MKNFLTLSSLIGLLVLSGCDKVAPPAESAAESPQATSAQQAASVQTAAKLDFAPHLVDAPVLGVVTPDFSYSVRSLGAGSEGNGGKNHIALEFWGLSADEAEQKIQAQLVKGGFKIMSRNSGNGSWASHYSNEKYADVLVNVAPMGARKPTTPNGTGTIYFEWKD